MEWSDLITQVFVALSSSGITAVATTRPKVILALAKAEAMLREGMGSEITRLRNDIALLTSHVNECREDRERMSKRINELEHVANQKMNVVETVGAFFHNIPAPAWMKDPSGRMYLINRQYEETWGISHLTYQGRMDEDIWPMEVSSSFRASDNLVLSLGRGLESSELIPEHPLENVSDTNPLSKWTVWRFPIVVDDKLFGIGGVAHRLEVAP